MAALPGGAAGKATLAQSHKICCKTSTHACTQPRELLLLLLLPCRAPPAQLDLKYKLPKMRYKGAEVETQRIRVDVKPLVTEVKEVPEEPTFALRCAGTDGPVAHEGR